MASQWWVEKRGSPRAMKKLDLLLGTLSGSRECRRGSDDLQMGVRQRARGPKRERLLGEEVDSRTGLRGQTAGFFLSQTLSKLADWAWELLLCVWDVGGTYLVLSQPDKLRAWAVKGSDMIRVWGTGRERNKVPPRAQSWGPQPNLQDDTNQGTALGRSGWPANTG